MGFEVKAKLIALYSLIIILLLLLFRTYNTEEWYESLRKDYTNHKTQFENVSNLFDFDSYYKVDRKNYDRTNSDLVFIFKNLGYKEIYTDGMGNVFFNKFSEGSTFRGLVFVTNPNYVIGIPESETIYISDNAEWIAYYYCYL